MATWRLEASFDQTEDATCDACLASMTFDLMQCQSYVCRDDTSI